MENAGMAVLACAAGFLLGSLPSGLWWGRLARGIDVRQHGSRNLGATNVFRVLGPGHGIGVLLLDIAKGAAAVLLARRLTGSEPVAIAAGLAAVLGHMLTPFAGFRGGKGVATGLGMWLLLAPAATGLALVAFGAILAATRRVSAGSLVAAAVLIPLVAAIGRPEAHALRIAVAILTAALVWVRHRGNIARLMAGAEPPLWGRRP